METADIVYDTPTKKHGHDKFEYVTDDASYDNGAYMKLTATKQCHSSTCKLTEHYDSEGNKITCAMGTKIRNSSRFTLTTGMEYTLKFRVKQSSLDTPLNVYVMTKNEVDGATKEVQLSAQETVRDTVKAVDTWYEVSYTFTAVENNQNNKYWVFVHVPSTASQGNTWCVDEIEIYGPLQ